MVQRGGLVVIGVSVGVAVGILTASLVFFSIRWYRKRANLRRCANERSLTSSTLPIRMNGLDTSIDSSASISCSVNLKPLDHLTKNGQNSWWSPRSKDRFASQSGIPQYCYKDIQKATENFTSILGQGSFGPVYKAMMPAGGVVAVKVLASGSKQGEKEFQTEVSLLGRLHHRNLVNLVGYCVDKGQRMLIYEFMSNGSLANLLYDEERQALSWEERLQIALDISHGIEYLHDGAVPPVIHRDLKSANILLDRSMRAKVADFGLSKEAVVDGDKSGLKGTYGYIDPAYISTCKFTMKSDLYSFGIILFEIITAIHPHQNLMEYVNLNPTYRRLWGPIRHLESIHPHANPRGNYSAPNLQTTGFIFVRIRGGFHEIRNSICDAVVVSRLLNATLVIPEIQSTTSSKGISSEFKSFAYLYNEDEFMLALEQDIKIVRTLPKNLKGARRKKEIPSFRVPKSASPYFYLHHVLPVLHKHLVVELVVIDGGCLQALLPPDLEEYQRLRCRVAFHALRFRQEVHELATKILIRLRASGRPFIAYEPGMTRDALAYYGCAELFQDVHTELIQHRRLWMIKRGIVKGNLSVNSAAQRLKGACPLMPEEIGILLRAYGYSWDTIIYVSGGEVFGGQKKLIPLHSMFENVVDRTSLSTPWELNKIYGRESNLVDKHPPPPSSNEETKSGSWRTSGPRPRPLPPPPARPKSYHVEGWWGWVAESDNEPESTVMELRTNAHKLLWEAIDYTVCVEADVFIPGFDRDGKGGPNFAGLVMGHRLYQSAGSRTYRLDRKKAAKLLEQNRDNLYQANHTWIRSVRKLMRTNLLDQLPQESKRSKPFSFLSFPLPECSCTDVSGSNRSQIAATLGVSHRCPSWMGSEKKQLPPGEEEEEEAEESDSLSSGLFFGDGGGGGGEMNNKEEAPMEDQEELEGGERR